MAVAYFGPKLGFALSGGGGGGAFFLIEPMELELGVDVYGGGAATVLAGGTYDDSASAAFDPIDVLRSMPAPTVVREAIELVLPSDPEAVRRCWSILAVETILLVMPNSSSCSAASPLCSR